LINKIKNLSTVNTLSKHEQLVQGVIEAIDSGSLLVGDQLPSINQMVGELGFARKTIVKAYEELKSRGLIESKKLKGYFIISVETNVSLKVALLLFSFQRFQQDFYNTFRKELGKRFQIDVFFHHNNTDVFETIFNNIFGKYGMYVVAPIPDPIIQNLLSNINPEKLLVIDRYIDMPSSYSYISQKFEQSVYEGLKVLLQQVKKYDKFIVCVPDEESYAEGVVKASRKFILDFEIEGVIKTGYVNGSIQKGNLYFFIDDSYLWEAIRDCDNKGYKMGQDVGILSHDDHLVKEIVLGGVTTISCDFKLMAKKAAKHIINKEPIQEIMPSNLMNRNSL